MIQLTADQIKRLAEVLDVLEPFDNWKQKVRKVVLDVGGARVTLSRRTKYASLKITKVEEDRS